VSGAVPFFMELSGVAAEFLQYRRPSAGTIKNIIMVLIIYFFKFSIYYIFYITFVLIFGESNE
jgi:fucose 4-O-acetylase-like acetyltransferase